MVGREAGLLPLEHTHTRRARAVAQGIFYGASAFNQPVGAWDVGQATNMVVRRPQSRSPGREPEGLGWLAGGGPLPLEHPLSVHVRWRGAVDVP